MSNAIYDSRFMFKYDSPFEGDANKELLMKLKRYIAQNNNQFTEIDWFTESRYLILQPDITTLFGDDVTNGVENNKLTQHIKSFIINITGISSELKKWCQEPVNVTNTNFGGGNLTPSDDDYSGDDADPVNNINSYNAMAASIIPTATPSNFSHNLSIGMQYDISTDKCLSYTDVCKMCINIARTKAIEQGIPKDETVEQLEKEKRKKLTQEIIRYKNNKLIDPLIESDLSDMSLEQLETCLEQCIQYQENFKTLEIFKRGFSAGSTIYDAVFPEGIPLGKGRKLCFKGVGKEILSTLFNATTTTGIAFQNILKKNNIHVSDELLTIVAFAEICISKVEIKKTEQKDDKNSKNEDSNEVIIPRKIRGDEELMDVD